MLQNLPLKMRPNRLLLFTHQIRKCSALIGVVVIKLISSEKIIRLAVGIIQVDGNLAAHKECGQSAGHAVVEHGTLKDVSSESIRALLTQMSRNYV